MGFLRENWRAIVEIAILAIVIYRVVLFVRGTRGGAIVSGLLLVLLAIALVTLALDLEVLRYLLRQFLGFLAIALIVIFQPELRRMLAEVGRFRIAGATREEREIVEVIVEAAERMSLVRIGMLVAIERAIPLADVVTTGVKIDCLATPEMLETIFFPNNAIHDGGVIISGNRIMYAACIFPLTQRQDLQKSLGTRHRAAIGLSEETDAVVVVVSEESGMISYAFKGQLVRGVSPEELRDFLISVLIQEKPQRHGPEGYRKVVSSSLLPWPFRHASQVADDRTKTKVE